MDASLIDSTIFGTNWATPESQALFSERARVSRWVRVVQGLASAQASLGIIPLQSAQAITAIDADRLDLEAIAEGTRATSHSTLGLIQVLQQHLPEEAREHVYYGATVQDVSDTSAALEMVAVAELMWRDLRAIEDLLLRMAEDHRSTPMLGRTHGQPGAPISFGFKVAGWVDEIGRSIERLAGARARWGVGQLAGAVGVMAFHGSHGPELRRRFCAELDLAEPRISWTGTRDRLVEFGYTSATAATALQRIANEIYNLQREEIGELIEGSNAETVGSITMPHKRNPENSEQIVVLARLVRSGAAAIAENAAGEHERDGSTWKAEWLLLPHLGHHVLAALRLSTALLQGLTVDVERMEANLHRYGVADSQELLRRLSARLGKHNAQHELGQLYKTARETGQPVADLLGSIATDEERQGLDVPALGSAEAMVDSVIEAARRRRAAEPSVLS